MEIRKLDYEKNIDEVVNLLNRCFPKKISKEHFIWKHKYNPFGRSHGFLAIEDNKIVGLRMFMKWKFLGVDKVLTAIRPVDTCTDPDYQGRGIFKKLTLQGLEETKGEYDLIFNTPNSNSITGYLKMGWKQTEKPFNYRLGFVNPFLKPKEFDLVDVDALDMEFLPSCKGKYSTMVSGDYFKWRYRFPKYKIAKFKDKTIAVFKVEKIKGMKVILVFEFCGDRNKVNDYLNSLALKQGVFWIYYLKDNGLSKKEFFVSLKRGKQDVVLKDNGSKKLQYLNFSAGDLEGIM